MVSASALPPLMPHLPPLHVAERTQGLYIKAEASTEEYKRVSLGTSILLMGWPASYSAH